MTSDPADSEAESAYPLNRYFPPVTAVAFAIFTSVVLLNAWVVDDAYITFRSVDNFVNGRGLTWNPEERVQVYTHPMWMFLVSACYAVTSELFFTSIALSLVLSLAAVFVLCRALRTADSSAAWKCPLLVLLLINCKAFLDYAASGLENPLSYFIAALFLRRFLSSARTNEGVSLRELGICYSLAALAFFNRADAVLLYMPALLYLLCAARGHGWRRVIGVIILGTLPATLWELFSLFYYGFPFPNTAYAKMLGPGISQTDKLARGLGYARSSMISDPSGWFIGAAAAVFVIRERASRSALVFTGALVYVAFTIVSAASATHMGGRFFSIPFLITTFLVVRGLRSARFAGAIAAGAFIHLAWSPVSPFKFGTESYTRYSHGPSMLDTKWFAWREGAALMNWESGARMPMHPWYLEGLEIRNTPPAVHIGGGYGKAIGYIGFAAGPEHFFIDPLGLSDPLLARLPALREIDDKPWQSGHYTRRLPAGYLESIQSGENRIVDPKLHEYYDAIRVITRGPLVTGERFGTILKMNFGGLDKLLEGFDPDMAAPSAAQHAAEAADVRIAVRALGG